MPTKPTKPQDRIAELQLAELQGRQAFHALRGQRPQDQLTHNPYTVGTDEHNAWLAGLWQAYEDGKAR